MVSFIDSVDVEVRGGAGGAGVSAFEKRKGKPRGKPTGGSGGRGGDLLLEADPGTGSLLRYERRPHWKAQDGTHGEGDLKVGRVGEDLVLPVPLGTIVREAGGTLLADLVEPGQRLAVAKGGRGGRGNASFVTPNRRAPTFCEQGEYGEVLRLNLELQMLADAALIGYPNAGKSTLISRVSAAKPKVADYPFTTLTPHLGVVAVGEREFVLVDVPGLIEGAADGKGLGHEFLRHAERAGVLVLLLDPSPLQEDPPERQYDVLVAELEAHSPELASRPRVIALSKSDLPGVDLAPEWARARSLDVIAVSAVTGDGIDVLMHRIGDAVDSVERQAPDREGYVLHRPLSQSFSVTRSGSGWLVAGRSAERAINLDDLTVPEAADLVAHRLDAVGVDDALRRAGAVSGDDVRIGELVFTFDPESEHFGAPE
jgi:GTP-binding protein